MTSSRQELETLRAFEKTRKRIVSLLADLLRYRDVGDTARAEATKAAIERWLNYQISLLQRL